MIASIVVETLIKRKKSRTRRPMSTDVIEFEKAKCSSDCSLVSYVIIGSIRNGLSRDALVLAPFELERSTVL